MTYGQQPDQNGGNVPPPPPAPGLPPGQSGYGAPPPAYGASPGQQAYGAPTNQYGYGGTPGQPGYAGWAAAPVVRPGSVTAGAVLAIIGGVIATLFGLLFLAVSGMPEAQEVLHEAGFHGSVLGVLGGIVMVIGILVLVFAIFALKGKYWAAIGLAVIGVIYVLLSVFSLIQGQGGVLLGVIWVGLSVGLLMSGASRTWFKAQG